MRFCFYSGYRDLKGGYTTLLLSLIKELRRQNKDVLLINYNDGIIIDDLNKSGVNINLVDLDVVSNSEIGDMILPTDIFIVTKFFEFHRCLLKHNPRIIYYDINDYICYISIYKFNFRFDFLGKKLIRKLLDEKSLFFMDDTGLFNLKKEFNILVKDPVFIPIPVNVSDKNEYLIRENREPGTVVLTYIGRSVNWKMFPLKKIIKDVAAAKISKKILFSIVVDSLEEFRKYINVSQFEIIGRLEIKVQENMSPSKIDDFLLTTSDLHFAMGTAALDAAKLGIPTIVVDYATKEFDENYSYTWLHQTTDFNLGRNLDKMEAPNGITMQRLLSEFINSQEYVVVNSEKSYNYVSQNHNLQNVGNKFIRYSEVAGFRIRDAKPFVPFLFNFHTMVKYFLIFFQQKETV